MFIFDLLLHHILKDMQKPMMLASRMGPQEIDDIVNSFYRRIASYMRLLAYKKLRRMVRDKHYLRDLMQIFAETIHFLGHRPGGIKNYKNRLLLRLHQDFTF